MGPAGRVTFFLVCCITSVVVCFDACYYSPVIIVVILSPLLVNYICLEFVSPTNTVVAAFIFSTASPLLLPLILLWTLKAFYSSQLICLLQNLLADGGPALPRASAMSPHGARGRAAPFCALLCRCCVAVAVLCSLVPLLVLWSAATKRRRAGRVVVHGVPSSQEVTGSSRLLPSKPQASCDPRRAAGVPLLK